ncbi:MAG: uroporphyrinogen decarboxylase family protein [Armatimonadota bacterium]
MAEQMTGKQRVLATFEGKATDRVPIYCAGLSRRIASHVLGREAFVGHGSQRYREAVALWEGEAAHQEFLERTQQDVLEVSEKLDLDLVRPAYWRYNVRPTKRLDEYTFFYGDEDGEWWVMRFDPETELYQETARSPRPEPTIEDIERQVARLEEAEPPRPTPESFPELQAAVAYYGERRAVPGSGVGVAVPRERHWLEAIALRPDLVRRYLVACARRNAANPPVMKQMGLTLLFGGGDFAGKNGPLYSPKAFHECMLPALQIISRACHEHGCYHLFASDGNLWPVAEDLFGNSGVDGFYEIDRRAGMDLSRLRDTFPHLKLLGGISSETLHLGTPEDVRAETLSALEVAKERGQIIVGVSNQVVPKTPPENFDTMMETLHEHR